MWTKVFEYWQAFKDFIWSCFLSLFEMLKDILLWAFEQLLTLVLAGINGLGALFNAFNVTQYISSIPDDVRSIMALTGIDTATTMIAAALFIRFLLQLIPFVRLGS